MAVTVAATATAEHSFLRREFLAPRIVGGWPPPADIFSKKQGKFQAKSNVMANDARPYESRLRGRFHFRGYRWRRESLAQ
jgi:hypothetical protein